RGVIVLGSASGAVNGTGENSAVGGLVGDNGGTIRKSHASGAVSGVADSQIGGLVGFNDVSGVIVLASASGAVNGAGENSAVGGLVGREAGRERESNAAGAGSGEAKSPNGGPVGVQEVRGRVVAVGAAWRGNG